jgi:hypothetical protein
MNVFSNEAQRASLSVFLDTREFEASNLLAKLLGFFAQRAVPIQRMSYTEHAGHGKLLLSACMGEHDWQLLAAKTAQTEGVLNTRLEYFLALNQATDSCCGWV